MALKDWKKGKSNTYNPLFIKKGTYGNNEQSIGIASISDDYNKWEADFFGISTMNYEKFVKKSQAISFAKKYMRSH